MRRHWLKFVRAMAALVVLVGLFGAFADFRGLVPASVSHRLASIQFVPSMVALFTGASLAVAGLVVMVATLLVGRVYCSAICPLGIFQDVIGRVAGLVPGTRKRLVYSRGYPRLRQVFFLGCLAGILAGWAGFTLSLLDPYSVFGRMVSGLFRPVVTLANNALVKTAGALGTDALYRVEPQWAGVGALALPAGMLVLILILVVWRKRLYCNTVCPVGALLGFLSSRGAFRLGIDANACRKCGDCLRVCKSQCIDLRSGAIDFSLCVACFNCVGVCKEHGISYKLAWKRGPKAAPVAAAIVPDPRRREFLEAGASLAGAMGGWLWFGGSEGKRVERMSRVVSPPGSSGVARFLSHCTACQLCVSACPTHVLRPSFLEYGLTGLMKPRLDYRHSFCNFGCNECGRVCPDGAISLLDLADKQLARIGCAQLDLERCVVKTKGTDCAACSEHCPTKAANTIPYGNNLRLPQVDETLCVGCGACEYACPAQPVKAITVAGLNRHERAQKRAEPKAERPKGNGDFPF
jgi:ferredoxin